MTTKALTQVQAELKLRNPKTQILAVSKLQSLEKIQFLHEQGQKLFAENYVQEALEKQEKLQHLQDIEWHFIGRLQKNKVKFVLGRFALIHSVDSLDLAKTLNRKAAEMGLQQKVLLQLNLAEEETKGGFSMTNFEALIPDFLELKSLQICGLMTMPPLFENPEQARPFFKKLFDLRHQFVQQLPHLQELSMGTSSDYLIAAEEGATFVRLGTLIFGDRPQK